MVKISNYITEHKSERENRKGKSQRGLLGVSLSDLVAASTNNRHRWR